jgi:hypothetical protein
MADALTITQGDVFRLGVAYPNPDGSLADLDGFTARMQFRRTEDAEEADVDLSSDDGDIELVEQDFETDTGVQSINILVTIRNAVTKDLTDQYETDLKIYDADGEPTTVLRRTVYIAPSVTR